MRIVRHTLASCFVLLSLSILAQPTLDVLPCATPAIKSSWLTEFQKRHQGLELRSGASKFVAMTIHVVGTDEGKDYLNGNVILDALCALNQKFAHANIQFFIKDDFNYINNSLLFAHDKLTFPQVPALFSKYNVPSTVNVYFVQDPMGACGYNYMPGGKSMGIVLSNDCTNGKDANWAHEMGHYLSLPHTFYGWEMETPNFAQPAPHATKMGVEVEMADGQNCAFAGDGFCDTPADYLAGRWYCDDKGISITKQMDPSGTYFCSDGSLIMSYSLDECAERFSPNQAAAMHSYLGEELVGHFMDSAPCAQLGSVGDILKFPGNKVVVNTFNRKIFFNWEKAPNASGYLLEVSLLANFGTTVYRGITRDTSMVVDNLSSSRPYYWRIRPFNAMYACKTYSAVRSFTINQTTGLPVLNTLHEVELFPNPVHPGEDIRLRFEADENMKLQATLVNTLGAVVHQQNLQTNIGNNEYQLRPNQQLPFGVYWLWIKGEKGALSRKIVVH